MRKTRKMLAIEARYRKPIDTILRDLYGSLGSLQGVAEALHVDVGTAWAWMNKFNIPRRQWMVPPELAAHVQNPQEKAS